MRLSEVLRRLEAEEIVPAADYEVEVRNVCASDLLSDILATEKTDFVILTGLTTVQVVRTAEVSEAIAVVLVRDKVAPADTVKFAQAKGLPLARTRFPMFEACVRLAELKG
jgi:hypothetical protein